MRRYYDLEKEELALLTEDQINHFVEVEIAHEGIEPVPEPQVPTLEDVGIVKGVILYRVGGSYGLLFIHEADAKAVAQMPVMESKYDYNLGSEWRWAERESNVIVQEEHFYTQADVVRVAKALQENKAKQEPFEESKRKWNSYLKTTGAIRAKVWEAVADAKEHHAEIQLAIQSHRKFRALAGGDETITDKFFRDAYTKKGDTFIAEVLIHPSLKKVGEEEEEDQE